MNHPPTRLDHPGKGEADTPDWSIRGEAKRRGGGSKLQITGSTGAGLQRTQEHNPEDLSMRG